MYRKIRKHLTERLGISSQDKQRDTKKQNPNSKETYPVKLAAKESDKTNNSDRSGTGQIEAVDGLLYWVSQRHIKFGRNAKEPRDTRMILVPIRRNEPLLPYIPTATTIKKINPNIHFHLPDSSIKITDEYGQQQNWYAPYSTKRHLTQVKEILTVHAGYLGRECGTIKNEIRPRMRVWLSGRLAHA